MADKKDSILKFGLKSAIDVNALPGSYDLSKRQALAESALMSTALGRSGVVKVVKKSDGKVGFKSTVTGVVHETIQDAFDEADRLSITEVASFERRKSYASLLKQREDELRKAKATGNRRLIADAKKKLFAVKDLDNIERAKTLTNKYGAFASVIDDINRQAFGGSLSTEKVETLTRAGIDVNDLKKLSAHIITMGTEEDNLQKVATKINQLRESGELHGISVLDKDGGRLIHFRANGKALDTYQSHILMSVMGYDVGDKDVLQKLVETGNTAKLASQFEKVGKRIRAFTSARDISLAGDELQKLSENFYAAAAGRDPSLDATKKIFRLSDVTLISDPQYEILKIFAHGKTMDYKKAFGNEMGEAFQEMYKNLDVKGLIDDMLDNFDTKFAGKTEIDEFKSVIRKFSGAGTKGKWRSDALAEVLQKEFVDKALDPDSKKRRATLVGNIYKSLEQGFDGSDQLNADFLDEYIDTLRTQSKDLQKTITNSRNDRMVHNARRAKMEVDSLIERLERGELGQITGRGRLRVGFLGSDTFMNIKNAFDARRSFEGAMSRFGLVINKFSLKAETDIAGQIESFVLSGIGQPRDTVFVDPIGTAFFPEVFADKDTIKAMEIRASQVMADYQKVLESGVVPEKVKQNLRRQADQVIEGLSPEDRSFAYRNKIFAQEILDMLRSGISPREAPMMISMLHNSFATELYRTRKGFTQLASPDLFRFAIDTEKILLGTGEKLKLKSTFARMDGIKTSSGSIDVKGLNFRVDGHKMLIHNNAVGTYFHSLGGFDLDDKGMPRKMIYEVEDKVTKTTRKRLGFLITRQPTGPEELVIGKAQLDQQTIKALFNDSYFDEQLKTMLEASPDDEVLKIIRQSLDFTGSNIDARNLIDEAIERRAIDVEEKIVQILEDLTGEGKASFYRLSESVARRVGPIGSTLALKDLVKVDLDTATGALKESAINPKFTRQGIYKALLEDGAFDMSKDLMAVFNKYNIDNTLKLELDAISKSADPDKFNKMLEAIARSGNPDEVSAIMTAAKDIMQIDKAKEANGILGMYINRSMLIGSGFNQYEDFFNSGIIDDSVRAFMNERYNAFVLAQETAVDMNINLSTSKVFMEETARLIESSLGTINVDNLGTSLGKTYKLATEGGAVTVDDVGSAMIANLGRRIGFARAVALKSATGADEEKLLGIDEFLLTRKASAADRYNILENIILGMEDAKRGVSEGALSGDILYDALDDDIENYQNLLKRKDPNEIEQFLLKHFGIKAGSTYATLSTLNKGGTGVEAIMESIRKSYTARVGENEALKAARVTEAQTAAAQTILERNKNLLDSLFDVSYAARKEFTDSEQYSFRLLTYQAGEQMLADFRQAEAAGLNIHGVITAFDKLTLAEGSKVDLAGLKVAYDQSGAPVNDLYDEFMKKVFQARKLNAVMRTKTLPQDEARKLLDALNLAKGITNKGPVTPVSSDEIYKYANVLLNNEDLVQYMKDQFTVGSDEYNLLDNILLTLTDNEDMIENSAQRVTAATHGQVLRNLIFEQELVAAGVTIPASRYDPLEDRIKDVIDTEAEDAGVTRGYLDRLRSAKEDSADIAVDRAKYKRLNLEMAKDLYRKAMKDPILSKGIMGLGALVVGSIGYQAMKSRSQEDIEGPPLLPGGSMYESDFPVSSPRATAVGPPGFMEGTSFKVNIYGDRSQVNRFVQSAGSMVNGNMNTTMYNRIPDVGRDPYQSIASSY